jgi:hypothetical protein
MQVPFDVGILADNHTSPNPSKLAKP